MPIFDASNATIHVFTRKAGVLSRLGHDLELAATKFTIDIDQAGTRVTAEIDASALQVLHALVDGVPQPTLLSASDKAKIQQSSRDDVLQCKKYPHIRFASTAVEATPAGLRVSGTLQLHGVTRPLFFEVRRGPSGTHEADVALSQPDYGIAPFSAMLGALRIAPTVHVHIAVPLAA